MCYGAVHLGLDTGTHQIQKLLVVTRHGCNGAVQTKYCNDEDIEG